MLDMLELEITNRCPLVCDHCYAESGPTEGHGSMSDTDWRNVIDQAVDLEVNAVQFIGGEPLSRPNFPELCEHAINAGLKIEVFSNLFHVKEQWWELFSHPNVSLASSYYSDADDDHDSVTGRRGSHARTRANIAEAIRRSIPLRVGIIDVHDGQRAEQAKAEIEALGVRRVKIDRMRGVGRGARGKPPKVSELCGRCGQRKAAVSHDGDVSPCVLGRFLVAGNVLSEPLGQILTGAAMRRLIEQVPRLDPSACKPDSDGNDCRPAETDACGPKY